MVILHTTQTGNKNVVIVARVIDDCKPRTFQRSSRNSRRNYDVEISLECYVVNIRKMLTHHVFKTNIVCAKR